MMSTSQTITKFERKAKPTTPGEILKEEFLVPLEMTQNELAKKIGCDVKTINRLCNGHTKITAEIALYLGEIFDTTPEFWMNLQMAVDLWEAEQTLKSLRRTAAG